ncbi:MAG: cytochrome c peroxidase [Bacteroidota bacterium]
MKNASLRWILTITFLTIALILTSFREQPQQDILKMIRQSYLTGLDQFSEQSASLISKAKALTEESQDILQLQQALIACRDDFKKIEYLATFYSPDYCLLYLNGAPLPHLSPDDNRSVVEPEGLQVLDELIFTDNPFEHKEEIVALTEELHDHAETFANNQLINPIYDRFVFEAARYELIRIFTLGVTGFDTPGSIRGLEESYIALKAVKDAILSYGPMIEKKDPELLNNLTTGFEEGLAYLKENNDFDTFDRLHFLTHHLNPLFKELLTAHKKLGIETIDETLPVGEKLSLNYDAENIFSNELINPFYFSEQLASQYNAEVVELGKLLFFDPILSENRERSCASCHKPGKAFTDGRKKSLASGFNGTVDRNSPTLINASYSERFFYDLRANKLEKQLHHVIFDEREFNTDFFKLFNRIKKSPEYMDRFKEAYPQLGNYALSRYSLTTALSSYVISLNGWNSPFDEYVRGEREELDKNVKAGFNLFMGKAACGTCHFAPTFNGLVPPLYQENESEILGVPSSSNPDSMELDPDLGRMLGQLQENFEIYGHSFKTVTVRNIEKTAPYMHNGVYKNLEEVMDFYNKGGGAGMGLDVPYQTLPPDPLELSDLEINQLIAFMKSLTNTDLGKHKMPTKLPAFPDHPEWNNRTIGGDY